MMLTEAQAREKWCPFSRVIHVEKNQTADDTCASSYSCIASECMAWRWRDKSGTREGEPNYYPGEWQGWCGLAGRATP